MMFNTFLVVVLCMILWNVYVSCFLIYSNLHTQQVWILTSRYIVLCIIKSVEVISKLVLWMSPLWYSIHVCIYFLIVRLHDVPSSLCFIKLHILLNQGSTTACVLHTRYFCCMFNRKLHSVSCRMFCIISLRKPSHQYTHFASLRTPKKRFCVTYML